MRIFRFLTITVFATLLSGCLLVTKTGTVVIDRSPYELSITETNHIPVGYQVRINGEDMRALEAETRSTKHVTFYPLKTKYGTLTAEMKADYHLIDSDLNFRFFLNGEYIGTVNFA